MDILTQKKFLIITIIVLAVLNLSSIGFMMLNGNHKHQDTLQKPVSIQENRSENPRDVSKVLETELNLNSRQVEQIKKLRSEYFDIEKELSRTIRSARDSMNSIMFNKSTNEEFVKVLARRISETEYEIELLRFEQAKRFKNICTPEQLEKFVGLVKEIRDYFRPDNQSRRKGNQPTGEDRRPPRPDKDKPRRD